MRALVILVIAFLGIAVASHGSQGNSPATAFGNASIVTHAKDIANVKAICDASHDIYSGETERDCGLAQQETGTEYLCNSTEANASCWVEYTGYYGNDW